VVARAWDMAGPGGRLAVETGSGGDFYLEDAPAGSYRGTLTTAERSYACRLAVSDFPEPVHELKDGIVCE
jgi:hypothetical protein